MVREISSRTLQMKRAEDLDFEIRPVCQET